MNRVKQWTVDSSQLIRAPLEYPHPPGGLVCVASKGLAGRVLGSVAMIGVNERFPGSVAKKGVRGVLKKGRVLRGSVARNRTGGVGPEPSKLPSRLRVNGASGFMAQYQIQIYHTFIVLSSSQCRIIHFGGNSGLKPGSLPVLLIYAPRSCPPRANALFRSASPRTPLLATRISVSRLGD